MPEEKENEKTMEMGDRKRPKWLYVFGVRHTAVGAVIFKAIPSKDVFVLLS